MNLKAISEIPRRALVAFLRLYQRTLSPDHGWFRSRFPVGYCRFQPSCSEYAVQVVERDGVFLGVPRAAWRVLRCNPWSRGGEDLP